MSRLRWALGATLVLGFASAAAASDPVGIYAKIDKVVLEPDGDKPDRIQVWGTFMKAVPKRGEEYTKPAGGYFYYALVAGKEDECRREWADLKKVAGTGQCVAFASRHEAFGSLRKKDEEPKRADPYPIFEGVTKVNDNNPNAKLLNKAGSDQ